MEERRWKIEKTEASRIESRFDRTYVTDIEFAFDCSLEPSITASPPHILTKTGCSPPVSPIPFQVSPCPEVRAIRS